MLLGLLLGLLAPQGQPELIVRGPEPAVVTVGASCRVEIRLEGTARVGRDPVVQKIAGAMMQLRGGRSVDSTNFVNGRLTRSRYVQWQLVITPTRTGVFTVPPIELSVAGRTLRSQPLKFEAVKEITGNSRSFLEVEPSATKLYVHEPLRFRVDYGIDNRLKPARTRDGLYYIEIIAPWLRDLDGAVPLDVEEKGDLRLYLGGQPQDVFYTENYARGDKRFHRFQFSKAFLPSKVGKFELSAPILKFVYVAKQGVQTFFGPSGTETEELYAYGEPIEIEVLPIPEEGRPTDYFGAVGRFRIAADVDKQAVKVGNSVKLTLTIEGLGNTEFLRVPELDELEGFHVLGKTVQRDAEQVVVTYDITPLSDTVTEVPAIAWNFFDTTPGVEAFAEVATDPIPLEVEPLAEGETLRALPGEERRAVTPGVDDIYDMKPIAAESVPVVPAPVPSRGVAAVWMVAPWLGCSLLVLGLSRRRRLRADVAGQRARGAHKQFKKALADGREPADALVAYLADRLGVAEAAVIGPDLETRLSEAGVDGELASELQRAVESGVAARYGGTGGVDEQAARALVARLEGQDVRRGAGAVTAMLLCCAVLAGALPAQDAARGEEAYRSGDYATAAAAFARAADTPDADGRVLYNLGNSLVRSGRLGEALVAYERARRVMPRDPELLANIRLVKERLELGTGEGEPFLQAVAELRSRFTGRELLALCVLFHALAAVGLVLGRSRGWLRVMGGVFAVPAVLLSLELLWFAPVRADIGIVVTPRAELVAEPQAGLDAVLVLREGVEVEVLSTGPEWTRVRVQGRSGYVPAATVGVVG